MITHSAPFKVLTGLSVGGQEVQWKKLASVLFTIMLIVGASSVVYASEVETLTPVEVSEIQIVDQNEDVNISNGNISVNDEELKYSSNNSDFVIDENNVLGEYNPVFYSLR